MPPTAETIGAVPLSQMAYFEAQFGPEATVEASYLWDAAARERHLYSIPNEGFNPPQLAETIDQVVASRFPVNNFTSLHRRPNIVGKENTLGSWGIGEKNYGEFSVYDLLDRMIPEKRLGTIAHESMHANTPLRPENAHLYGGEAERLEAERHVFAVTNQSLVTGVHLNGYHEWLIERYNGVEKSGKKVPAAKRISYATLAEETSAIMAEMALTNRNGLEEVQARQHKELEDVNRRLRVQGKTPHIAVPLLSTEGRQGTVLAGVDATLVKLLDGINNHADLVAHVRNLKAKLYAPASFAKVQQRESYRNPPIVVVDDREFAALAAYLQLEAMRHRKNKLSLAIDDGTDGIDDLTKLDLALV